MIFPPVLLTMVSDLDLLSGYARVNFAKFDLLKAYVYINPHPPNSTTIDTMSPLLPRWHGTFPSDVSQAFDLTCDASCHSSCRFSQIVNYSVNSGIKV